MTTLLQLGVRVYRSFRLVIRRNGPFSYLLIAKTRMSVEELDSPWSLVYTHGASV